MKESEVMNTLMRFRDASRMKDMVADMARRVVAMIVTVVTASSVSVAIAYAEPAVLRVGGADRYETMAQVAQRGFTHSDAVVVATGEDYHGALLASALAGVNHCPVLLTPSGSLSPQTSGEITRLGCTKAYVIGGTGAVSDVVVKSLTGMGITVTRYAGATVTEESVTVMGAVRAMGSTSDTVIIASGDTFADALSIGPKAYQSGSPILYATGGDISDTVLNAIHEDPYARRIVIVGGPAAVSDSVPAKVGTDYEVTRIWGQDRYETSARVIEQDAPSVGGSWEAMMITTGENYPDALSSAALCGYRGERVLLVASSNYEHTKAAISAHLDSAGTLVVLGGEDAVSSSTVDAVLGRSAADPIIDGVRAIEETAGTTTVWNRTGDYDGDGRNETFALTGTYDSEWCWWRDATLWGCDSHGKVTRLMDFGRAVEDNPGVIEVADGHVLFTFEQSSGSPYDRSNVFGVRNGVPMEVQMVNSFDNSPLAMVGVQEGRIVGVKHTKNPDLGYHEFQWLELGFDASSFTLQETTLLARGAVGIGPFD